MAKSTGPILAAGGLVWTSEVLLGSPPDWFESTARIGVGTGLAVGTLVVIEKAAPDLATAFAWAALVTVLFVRTKKNKPTPLERLLSLVS